MAPLAVCSQLTPPVICLCPPHHHNDTTSSSLHSLLAERGEPAEALAKEVTTAQVRYDLMEAFEEVSVFRWLVG